MSAVEVDARAPAGNHALLANKPDDMTVDAARLVHGEIPPDQRALGEPCR